MLIVLLNMVFMICAIYIHIKFLENTILILITISKVCFIESVDNIIIQILKI